MLRAVLATLVVVALGAGAHSLGGGTPLQPVPVAVVLVLVGPTVWFIVRARTSVARMVLATGSGQVLTHLALTAMAPSSGGTAAAHPLHDAVTVTAGGSSPTMALHVTGPMVLAHLLATVVASLLLTLGDDAVRAAARRLRTALQPAPAPAPCRVVPGADPVRRLTGRSVRPVGGRAPPLRTC